jgi:ABC-2 type transport system ATP-binding protein
MDEAEMLSDSIVIIDKGRVIADGTMRDLRKIIPQNIRIDIAKDSMDIELLKSYGSVVDTGTGTLRVFTFESTIKEISDFAIKKNLSFTVSPITLDDVFVSLVGKNMPDTEDDHRNTSINYDNGN